MTPLTIHVPNPQSRREHCVEDLLAQVALFRGVDPEKQAQALEAAALMSGSMDARQIAETALVLLDRMDVSLEERAAFANQAAQILRGETRVELTPQGDAARLAEAAAHA